MRLSIAVVALVLGFALAGCFEGPQGPQGPQGRTARSSGSRRTSRTRRRSAGRLVRLVRLVHLALTVQEVATAQPAHRGRLVQQALPALAATRTATHSVSPRAIPSANSSVAPARNLSLGPARAAIFIHIEEIADSQLGLVHPRGAVAASSGFGFDRRRRRAATGTLRREPIREETTTTLLTRPSCAASIELAFATAPAVLSAGAPPDRNRWPRRRLARARKRASKVERGAQLLKTETPRLAHKRLRSISCRRGDVAQIYRGHAQTLLRATPAD